VQVHSPVIAGQPVAFDRLVSGGVIEAQTRSLNLPDVQLEDFIRFCQFAYCGDYAPPEFIINEPNTTESDLEDSQVGEMDQMKLQRPVNPERCPGPTRLPRGLLV
jgi:hypothetical protein